MPAKVDEANEKLTTTRTSPPSQRDEIKVASTTDSQEEIDAAAGVEAEEEEGASTAEETAEKKEDGESAEKESESASEEGEEADKSEEDKKASESESEEEEEAEEEEEQEEGTADKKPGSKKLLKRIDKLTKRLRQTERERDEERRKNAAAGEDEDSDEEESEESTATTAETDKPRPKRADFKSDEEYDDALWDWRQEKREAATRQANAQAELKRRFDTFVTAKEQFVAEHDDWDDRVEDMKAKDVRIPDPVVHAIIDANRPDILYYLSGDPELCKKLVEMTPYQSVIEIGRIAASLDAKNPPRSTGKAKAATTAAASAGTATATTPTKKTPPKTRPITPVSGAGTKGGSKSLDEEDYQTYKERREKGER
jgi:hypothetical protein